MDDVIIDNTQPVEVVMGNRTISLRAKSFGSYLLDLVLKALLMFFFLSIDFCLFAKAGSYSVFLPDGALAPEIVSILTGCFFLSLVLMAVLSFSSLMQNCLLAFVFGVFVFMMLHQFALFDTGTFLSDTFRIYFSEGAADFVHGISDVAAAVLAGVLLLFYLLYAVRSSLIYLTGILLLINAYILFGAYLGRLNGHDFSRDYENMAAVQGEGNKFINIMLPNAASYFYLDAMTDKASKDNTKIENLKKIMLGFYAENGFKLYPNAYLRHQDGVLNQVDAMNPLSPDTRENMFERVISDRSWQFDRLNDKTDELKNNQLTTAFQHSGYQVSVYQSRGLEMCRSGMVYNVDRCVNKINMPANVALLAPETGGREYLLLAQWLESSGLFDSPAFIFKALNFVVDAHKIPVIGMSYKKLYVVNSLKVFDEVIRDLRRDKGNGVYYVYVDLPADMFVYNEFCMLKPQDSWLSLQRPAWIEEEGNRNDVQLRREAYAEQYACLFGKLQDFLNKINASGKAENMVVAVQGISAPADGVYQAKDKTALRMGSERMTVVALKDPKLGGFELNNDLCLASDIIKSYLFKTGKCQTGSGLGLNKKGVEELKKTLADAQVTESEVQEAGKFFDLWFKYWEKANAAAGSSNGKNMENPAEGQGSVSGEGESVSVEKKQVLEPINEDVIINKNIDLPEEVKLEDEVRVKSLKEEMAAHPLEASEAGVSVENSHSDEIVSESVSGNVVKE